jgi:hypothetical protein
MGFAVGLQITAIVCRVAERFSSMLVIVDLLHANE